MNLSPGHPQLSGRLLAPAVFQDSLQFFVPFTGCSLQSIFSPHYCIFICHLPKFMNLSPFHNLTGLKLLKECWFISKNLLPFLCCSVLPAAFWPFSGVYQLVYFDLLALAWYPLLYQYALERLNSLSCFFSLFLTCFLIFMSITSLPLSKSSLKFLVFWSLWDCWINIMVTSSAVGFQTRPWMLLKKQSNICIFWNAMQAC